MQYVRFQREQRIKNAREKIVLVVVIMKYSTEFLSENSELAARKILTKMPKRDPFSGFPAIPQRCFPEKKIIKTNSQQTINSR